MESLSRVCELPRSDTINNNYNLLCWGYTWELQPIPRGAVLYRCGGQPLETKCVVSSTLTDMLTGLFWVGQLQEQVTHPIAYYIA